MSKKRKPQASPIRYVVIDIENDDPYVNVGRVKVKGLTRKKGVRFAFDAIKLSGVDKFLLYLVIVQKYLEHRLELDGMVDLSLVPSHFVIPVKEILGSSLEIAVGYAVTKMVTRIEIVKTEECVEISALTPIGTYIAKISHKTAQTFFEL